MIGADFGYNILSYSISADNIAAGTTEGRALLGLKTGGMYMLSDYLALNAEFGYNLVLGLGGTNPDGSSQIDVTAPSLRTMSLKIGIAYNFD